jgi:DNA modification methylase
MRLIGKDEYDLFLQFHDSVSIEMGRIVLPKEWRIEQPLPGEFVPEESTVWSFPERGDWATHVGDYRGNWSPFIPRNLIERYTSVGDLVCDPMVGSGTTLVECRLLGRNAIGVDINRDAAMVAMNRLDFHYEPIDPTYKKPKIQVFVGDARKLDQIQNDTVDLVATHPPYGGVIQYSNARIDGDLSAMKFAGFLTAMSEVASECFRILKADRYCAILVGDTRRHRHYIPIHIGVLNRFLGAGFILKEDIIKLQHKTTSSRERWSGHAYDFYKIAHEHLYVFRKPNTGEKLTDYKYSLKWW